MRSVLTQWLAIVSGALEYTVSPPDFPGTVHVARSWGEAMEWARCYTDRGFRAPRVLDFNNREVPYAH